jgi:TrmH family RNA methyltransferase
MLSNSQAKFIASLRVKKYRQKYRNFLVEGDKMVSELLAQTQLGIVGIFALERWALANTGKTAPFFDKLNLVTETELAKISALSTPNQVLAIAEMPDADHETHWPAQTLCLYLDGIQDPGNMGSILRVADWFGMPAVYCSPETVDAYSPKVVQGSMGASLRVRTWEMPLETLTEHNPGLPVIGAVMDGENVFNVAPPGHGILIIGNEGKGISPRHERALTQRISIPRHPAGRAESLNAAVAAGILVSALQPRPS